MRREGPSVHALGLAASAAALLVAAAILPLDAPPLSLFPCPFRAATGFPCLTCGCTRAFHHAVRGEIAAAVLSNPAGAVLALVCVAHVAVTSLRLCGLMGVPGLPVVGPRRATWTIAGILAANWAFLALRGAP